MKKLEEKEAVEPAFKAEDALPYFLTQRGWRGVGLTSLTLAALMAVYGAHAFNRYSSMLSWIIYWGLFLILLLVAFYVVLLDIRFIRLQFALENKKLLREALEEATRRRREAEAKAETAAAEHNIASPEDG